MVSRILSRYVFKEAFSFFFLTMILFLGVLITAKMLKLASFIINKGVDISAVAKVFVAIVPSFLEIAVPLATLLGIMLAFARLSGDSEIVVIRASGISIGDLLPPVILFGSGAALIGLITSLYLRPLGNEYLENTLFDIARTKSTAGLTEGIFNELGPLTLYADAIDHMGGGLTRVVIDDRRNPENRKIVIAKRGFIDSQPEARAIIFKLFDGEIHEFIKGNYSTTQFTTNSLLMDPNEMQDGGNGERRERKSKEMSLSELNAEIALAISEREKLLSESVAPEATLGEANSQVPPLAPITTAPIESEQSLTKRINRLRIEVVRKFTMPCAPLVLALIALPLGVQPPRLQRAWGAGFSAALGMGVFVVYYGLLSLAMALAQSGTLSPWIGMWVPNIVCALLGVWFIRKISSEAWNSIAQGMAEFIEFTRALVARVRMTEAKS